MIPKDLTGHNPPSPPGENPSTTPSRAPACAAAPARGDGQVGWGPVGKPRALHRGATTYRRVFPRRLLVASRSACLGVEGAIEPCEDQMQEGLRSGESSTCAAGSRGIVVGLHWPRPWYWPPAGRWGPWRIRRARRGST